MRILGVCCPILIISIAVTNAICQQSIHVPEGKPVMIDGKLEAGEWNDASLRELPGLARLYVKQSNEYVWLAVELTNAKDGALDLYLAPSNGNIYDLHASAKLGERKLENGKWPEWTWWNNQGWVANVARADSFEKRTFLPTQLREYQILRSRFAGKEWRLRFEVLTPAEPEWKTTAYPSGSKNTDVKGWLVLKLE